MENSKELAGAKPAGENTSPTPPPNSPTTTTSSDVTDPPPPPPSRTPFTSLGQVDADLALARTLQEQEAAYMMLGARDGFGSEYAFLEVGSYGDVGELDGHDPEEGIEYVEEYVDGHDPEEGIDYVEEYVDGDFVDHGHDVDLEELDRDVVFARVLQDAEEREIASQFMAFAGLNDWGVEDYGEEDGGIRQDSWQGVDPDQFSYEELVALGEVVGTESRGLSADLIASLPLSSYKAGSSREGKPEQCVICQLDFEDGESLVVLSCKHSYHSECINKWLQLNKICPVCSTEVSTSENRHQV